MLWKELAQNLRVYSWVSEWDEIIVNYLAIVADAGDNAIYEPCKGSGQWPFAMITVCDPNEKSGINEIGQRTWW